MFMAGARSPDTAHSTHIAHASRPVDPSWYDSSVLVGAQRYVAHMDVRLDGKVALVTGASRGIGKAIAAHMVASGAQVMLSSRKLDRLEATAAEIGDVDSTAVYAGNAGDVDVADACVAATIERFGRLDVLVNNAATNPYFGPTLEVDVERYDKTMDVNLRGPLFWSAAAHRRAFAELPGVIVNIASVGGVRVGEGLGVYNMAKAALIHQTRQLAREIGPTRVVGIAPGLVATDFSALLVADHGEDLARSLPLGRIGEPDDIAHLAVFLASDRSAWITGETFVVDGGHGVTG